MCSYYFYLLFSFFLLFFVAFSVFQNINVCALLLIVCSFSSVSILFFLFLSTFFSLLSTIKGAVYPSSASLFFVCISLFPLSLYFSLVFYEILWLVRSYENRTKKRFVIVDRTGQLDLFFNKFKPFDGSRCSLFLCSVSCVCMRVYVRVRVCVFVFHTRVRRFICIPCNDY